MSYDEEEIEERGFRINDDDIDEPLEVPEEIIEPEEDPEDRFH